MVLSHFGAFKIGRDIVIITMMDKYTLYNDGSDQRYKLEFLEIQSNEESAYTDYSNWEIQPHG